MANFWDAIINKITGKEEKKEDKPVVTAGLDIIQVAKATAEAADPKLEQAKQEAMEAEKQKALAEDASRQAAAMQAFHDQQVRDQAAHEAAAAIADAANQFEIIKEHKLTYDDTLSALALHFYGHATPEYWGLIILANKNEIGDKVKDYTPGKVIKIPKLPDSMKK